MPGRHRSVAWLLLLCISGACSSHLNVQDRHDDAACVRDDDALELLQTHTEMHQSNLQSEWRSLLTAEWTSRVGELTKLLNGRSVLATSLLLYVMLVLPFAPTNLIVAATIFCDLSMTAIFAPLSTTVTTSFAATGVLFSAKNVMTCLLVPFAGRFIDGNEQTAMRSGLLWLMACTLGLAAVKNFWVWLVLRFLTGVSGAGIVWGGFAFLNELYADKPDDRRGALALAAAFTFVGLAIGPEIGICFAESPTTAFLLLFVVQISSYLALRFRLPPLPERRNNLCAQPGANVDMTLDLVADPDVRNPIIAQFLTFAFFAGTGTMSFQIMGNAGIDTSQQSGGVLLSMLPLVVVAMVTPRVQALVGGRTLQIVMMSAAGIAIVIASIVCATDLTLLTLTSAALIFLLGTVASSTPSMISNRSQKKYGGTGQVFVLMTLMDQLAQIVGPMVGGVICQLVGFDVMCASYSGCLLLYAIPMSLSTCWWPSDESEEEKVLPASMPAKSDACSDAGSCENEGVTNRSCGNLKS
mmetsp:Transcript_30679/g.57417  ORF Transcript_30679/g.57417 Transcript_30679/m.57417 type:complete len:525 (-) Transcript_30679:29-1603(-)